MELLLFDLFALIVVASSTCVVASKNPIHSVLFLILTFCAASALLLLIEVEFLAMMFIMVYVGAIAVLFLFVVMMLNTRLAEFHLSLLRYLPLGAIIGFLFLLQMYFLLNSDLTPTPNHDLITTLSFQDWSVHQNALTNVESLGQLIYTYYFFLFLLAGLILLVAMVAAIVLTVYKRKGVRRQDIYQQVTTDFHKTIYLTTHNSQSY
uniref:NADH-ubiquinone oxidoreductase chain 6 n=1 Tax=Jakoba libera TaxID=143017 RepID=M4QA71_JAKLI|nr:NADH dehydrogenase subunit 6 [Jakoba libera]AGH24246.1 NADH dehydrogenase subunit 6 [Jakoba libera]